jgi:hypothetical protein
MYIAPKGWVMVTTDYAQLELCTLAEDCYIRYGASKLRDVINAGVDCHAYMAVQLTGRLKGIELIAEDPNSIDAVRDAITKFKTEDEHKFAEIRQLAKICDFGYPGGLSPKSFVSYASGYGVKVTEQQGVELKETWMRAFPEMAKHLTADPCDMDSEFYIGNAVNGFIRNKCTLNAALNTRFQSLASSGFKAALWEVAKRGYPIVNAVHDELIYLLPEDSWLSERIRHVEGLMVESMRTVVPHVEIKVETNAMRRWCKKAKSNWIDGNITIVENF